MATCDREMKSGPPKVWATPEKRVYSSRLVKPVALLLLAMDGQPLETAGSIHIEPLNQLRSALRLAQENAGERQPNYKDDLYLISFIVPLMREVQRANVHHNYILPKHKQVLKQVEDAVIAQFSALRIQSFHLPDSFPEWMVPGQVATWANNHEGLSLWQSAEDALVLGWNPITKRIAHLGDDVWGLALDVDGLIIPFMVRLAPASTLH